MKRINAVKGGSPRNFRSNHETDVRLAWACRVANEYLEEPASPASIIRRAVEFYQEHLERLMEGTAQNHSNGYERVRIRVANRDNRSEVTEDEVLTGPLQSLSNMESAKRAQKPRIVDELAATLARWEAHAKRKAAAKEARE